MPGRSSQWYRTRWAPWMVVVLHATGGACAAGLVAAGVSMWGSNPAVCGIGRDCGWHAALLAALMATLYFTATLVTAIGLGVSELAGPRAARGRLVGALAAPPAVWLLLAVII